MPQAFHFSLHLAIPLLVAWLFFRVKWRKTALLFTVTMLVDLDHLLASPIYDPCRCSIGFHPLHGYIACIIYALLLLDPRLRVVGIGLLLHMGIDASDCFLRSPDCG